MLSLARFLQVRLGRMGGRVRKRHRRRPGQTTDAQTHRRTDAQTHRRTGTQTDKNLFCRSPSCQVRVLNVSPRVVVSKKRRRLRVRSPRRGSVPQRFCNCARKTKSEWPPVPLTRFGVRRVMFDGNRPLSALPTPPPSHPYIPVVETRIFILNAQGIVVVRFAETECACVCDNWRCA